MQKNNLELVCALPMFAGVGIADVRHVLEWSSARVRSFRRHETVFAMQSEVRHVFVVLSGALKISEYGENGASHILRICRPGRIVGLAHILGHLAVFPGSCIATEDSVVLVMDIIGFNSVLESLRYGPLGENLFRMMSDDLLASWRAQSILSCRTIGDRVMTYLRWMRAEGGSDEIVLPIDRQELAALLCVHPTALSRSIAKLVATGEISCRKNVFRLLKNYTEVSRC